MTRRRHLGIATVLAGVAMVGATPAGAHGIGGRTDLPLPAWQLAWAAGFAVASLCGARAFWSQPRLVAAADGGRTLVDTRRPVIRGLEFLTKSTGVFLFGVLMWAAWWGNPNGAVNIAGDALLIWFWVGLQLVSFLFGDVWRMFNPYVTIADSGRGFEPRFGVRKPPRSRRRGRSASGRPSPRSSPTCGSNSPITRPTALDRSPCSSPSTRWR